MGQKLKSGAKKRSIAVVAVVRAVAKSAARVIKAAKPRREALPGEISGSCGGMRRLEVIMGGRFGGGGIGW